ncbi:MAG: PilZ domain-containing protein [Syntrophales bacterium]|nr:PilZ domain-containing protein [Syntrophales bacterium]
MESSINNNREYSRVYAYIPLKYRVVPSDEFHGLCSHIAVEPFYFDTSILPEVENAQLETWFNLINEKLDLIIRLLRAQADGFQSLPYKAVNISGSGISFSVHEEVRVGDILEIKMVLSDCNFHPVYLCVYGEVVRVEHLTSGYVIAVRFVKMDDRIRDEIVRFVFERERQILRERRKG